VKTEPVAAVKPKSNGTDSKPGVNSTKPAITIDDKKEVKVKKKKIIEVETVIVPENSRKPKSSPSTNHKAVKKLDVKPAAPVTVAKPVKKVKKPVKLSKENVVTEEPKVDEEQVRRQNFDLRVELFKEIRRPQLRMDLFTAKLTEIVGTQKTRIEFLKMLEIEAKRFKRKRLAEVLAQQMTGL